MALPAVDPNLRILLTALRVQNACGKDDDLRREAGNGAAWSRVLDLSRCHGVTPLLYTALQRCGVPLPPEAESALRRAFHEDAISSLLYGRELIRIMRLLDASGIPALAFKGPALSMRLYGALALRPCRDLDLLVHRDDLHRATELVWRLGYRPAPGYEGDIPHGEKHIPFKRDGGFSLELHWAVSKPSFSFSLKFDELWRNREAVRVLDVPVSSPGIEDLALALSAHGTAHSWASLKWICDIAWLLKSPDPAWDRLLRKARRLGAERMLLAGMALAHEILGAPVPPEAGRRIGASDAASRITAANVSRILSGAPPQQSIERAIGFMPSRERLRDRIRIAAYVVRSHLRPTKRDKALLRLPGILGFVYWPLRFARLLKEYSSEIGAPLLAALAGRRD